MQKRYLLLVAMLLGCQSAPQAPSLEAPRSLHPEFGSVRVAIQWPARGYHTQWIPEVASAARVEILDASGRVVAKTQFERNGGAAEARASIDLPPGTGYVTSATLTDGTAETVAVGSSAPFAIMRNQATAVEVSLSPVIVTMAGTGATASTEDGIPAASASLYVPTGVAVDGAGSLYIVDRSHHLIRKVGPDGLIRNVVGKANDQTETDLSDLGDGQPASSATLKSPMAVAASAGGDLFIADFSNKRVRFVPAASGDRFGMAVTAGSIYTIATASTIINNVLAAPDGSVYYAEQFRVMRIATDRTITPVAGTGSTGQGQDGVAPTTSELSVPDGLVLDAKGNLLIADRSNHKIRVVCAQSGSYFGVAMEAGKIYTVAGVGLATSDTVPLGDGRKAFEASLKFPRGLALDARGNLYVADGTNYRIRVLSPDGIIRTLAGIGDATLADFSNLGDGGAASVATFRGIAALALGPGGSLYIADSSNHRMRRIRI